MLHTIFGNFVRELKMRFEFLLVESFVRLLPNDSAFIAGRQTEKNNSTRADTRVHPHRPLASPAQAAQVRLCPL